MPSILFLTAYPIEDASARYRVYQFIDCLERAGYKCTVAPFATTALFRSLQSRGMLATKTCQTFGCAVRRVARLISLSNFDVVVIHREAFPFLAPLVERWILRNHPAVIYSFDDAVYIGHGDVSTLNHPWLYRAKYGRGYDEVIRRSVHVIAGNRVLAGYACKHNPAVTIIPTVVDCKQVRFNSPRRRGASHVTIGWMGSRSTARYLPMIESVLLEIARVHRGKIKFRFFGAPEYRLAVSDSLSLPFNLAEELQELTSLDIGLMPMPDTEWTRGKCAFKAIQYMAAGVATVASPVGITTDVIHHNVTGLLANSPIEWFHALDRLVRDPALRERLAIAARHRVEESYSHQVWEPRLVALFDQVTRRTHAVRDSVAA